MAGLHIVGVIDTILHDWNAKTSTIWVRVGKHEIEIKRPMVRRFEWCRQAKDERIRLGDKIHITLRTVPKIGKRGQA